MMDNTEVIVKRKMLLESERERVETLNINSQEDHDSLFLTIRVRTAMQKNVIMYQLNNYDNEKKNHY